MIDLLLGPWPLTVSIAVFIVAAAATVIGGIRMTSLGDTLADRTGWGEAIFGAVFFAGASSLAGIVITAVTAAMDNPTLAYSNAVGGIAAQTVAIALADLFYRRGNLEHAAASLANILVGWLLVALLTLVALAAYLPPVTIAAIHPMTVLLFASYLGGLALIHHTSDSPMWELVHTQATRLDQPQDEDDHARPTRAMWLEFAVVGAAVGLGGGALALAAKSFVETTELAEGFVGAVLLGVVNGLPETVTAIAAVRRGALTLAIAAILGGNCFDALTVAVGDIFYRGGSLYHTAGREELFLTLASALMTVIVVGGLLVRQARGPGRVGFEGVLLIAIYLSIVGLLSA
jgi:cation:H+ antiporter